MKQEKEDFAYIIYNRKDLPAAKCRSGSNSVLLQFTFGVPSFPLWLSYGSMKWIRSEFLDEPSDQAEREEGSKIMRRYMLLTVIFLMTLEVTLVATRHRLWRFAVQRTHVREIQDLCGTMISGI